MSIAIQTQLRDIPTSWTLVRQAHGAEDTTAATARHTLFDRYGGSAWRYLLAVTRNESVAEDLYQEFALRVLRGDFKRAQPDKGKFRNYLKSALVNLVNDYHRNGREIELTMPEEVPAKIGCDGDQRDEFMESWRDELLHRTWAMLEQINSVLFAVLSTHVQNVDLTASEKGLQVGRQLGQDFTANRYRVSLYRAREKFSQLLIHEVIATLDCPTEEEIRCELKILRLLRYCARSN